MLSLTRDRGLYVFAVLFSVILSMWVSAREVVINPDAICYLKSAALFKTDAMAAVHLCAQSSWPFYSLLISWVSKLTASYVVAAYILNGIFSLITVVTFLAIIRFLSATPRIAWFGLLVILLAHDFNSVKQYIIRDHGFWAFYLLSIYFLLHYFRNLQWRFALLWSASLIIAALFRIEGGFFLLAMPWVAWFDFSRKISERGKMFLQLNGVTFALILLGGAWVLWRHTLAMGRLDEFFYQIVHGASVLQRNFLEYEATLATKILNSSANGQVGIVLTLVLALWYVISVIASLSLVYAGLMIYGFCKKSIVVERNHGLVLGMYVLINVAVTAVFMAENMFLSKRYLLALSLTLMIFVPFALEKIYCQCQKRQWMLILVLAAIFLSGVGGIFDFGYSKKYIRDAGVWVSDNVPQNKTILSNDLQVMYYTQHFGNDIFTKAKLFAEMSEKSWNKYDYIILRTGKNHIKPLHLIEVKRFCNKRGDTVAIYKSVVA
ncbi:hypothetical protein AYO45_05135 [Gammaproteobacteria bacterium SCGC AG-212-F23]|nr:hypothetical protein AYO45_05135 [Gammaproteobacteria bacterium SCGC AG-212-F23]